jgi:hypothetical protein
MKPLSQASRSPGRDLNPGTPEYEAGIDHDFRSEEQILVRTAPFKTVLSHSLARFTEQHRCQLRHLSIAQVER